MTPQVISVSSAASSAWIPVDYKQNPFNIDIAVVLSNTPSLTYKVEYTLDDVFNSSITPTAFSHSSLVSLTANSTGTIKSPVKAIRLTVTSWTSGTATMTALQGVVNPVLYNVNGDLSTRLSIHDEDHIEMGLYRTNEASWDSTCWLYAWKGTNAAAVQYGERQIYTPLVDTGYYFGTFFSDKLLSNSVVSLTDTCIARTGLSTKSTGLSYSSGWTASTNTAAFDTDYSYATVADKTITYTASGTAVAARVFLATNGGYGIVSIDGDYTRADHLPLFTNADYVASRCRSTDVGKRYISCYATSAYSECQCLADDLSADSHTIVIETTGTKPTASSDTRFYIEAMLICNNQNAGDANVHFVPIWWITHNVFDWSAQCYVVRWAPSGSSDYQFLGENHADNVNSREVTTALAVYVDTTDQTALAGGSYASGSMIRIDHTSTLRHKADLTTPVATKRRIYTAFPHRSYPLMCDLTLTWAVAGGITNIEYPVMLMLSERDPGSVNQRNVNFTSAKVGGYVVNFESANDDSIDYFTTRLKTLSAEGPKIKAFNAILSEYPDRSNYMTGYGGAYQDRSYFDEKLYIISVDGPTLCYGNGDIQRFVMGFGGSLV